MGVGVVVSLVVLLSSNATGSSLVRAWWWRSPKTERASASNII